MLPHHSLSASALYTAAISIAKADFENQLRPHPVLELELEAQARGMNVDARHRLGLQIIEMNGGGCI